MESVYDKSLHCLLVGNGLSVANRLVMLGSIRLIANENSNQTLFILQRLQKQVYTTYINHACWQLCSCGRKPGVPEETQLPDVFLASFENYVNVFIFTYHVS